MEIASLVVACCLVSQTGRGATDDIRKPHFVPRRAAAPAKLDDADSAEQHEPAQPVGPLLNLDRSRRPALAERADDGTQAADEASDGDRLARVANPPARLRPPGIVAEVISSSHTSTRIGGEPLTLADALSRGTTRREQLDIAVLYWKLFAAQADYQFAREQRSRFYQYTREQQATSALVRSMNAALDAALTDGEATLLRTQHELVQKLGRTSKDPLPLIHDLPQVGDYTLAREAPPAEVAVVVRTLSLRRAVIDQYADAIVAGVDALDAAADDFQGGSADLTSLIAAFDHLARQRKNFTAAVRKYNQDGAHYWIAIARPNTSVRQLVGQMVMTQLGSTTRSSSEGTASRTSGGAAGDVRTRRADSDDDTTPPDSRSGRQPQKSIRRRAESSDGAAQPPGKEPASDGPATSDLVQHEAKYASGSGGAERSGAALYRGMETLEPPLRTERLARLLYWDRSANRDSGGAVRLHDVLQTAAVDKRRAVIEAYWAAAEQVAVHQAIDDELAALEALAAAALPLGKQPAGASAMLRLRAVKDAAKADKTDARIALTRALHELARLAGRGTSDALGRPATAPHAARYGFEFEAQPSKLVEARGLDGKRKLAELLHAQMQSLAGSIVEIDGARAAAVDNAGKGVAQITAAVAASQRQADHTIDLIRATTSYNLAIADYVLAILPADASPDVLAGCLVLDERPADGT